MLHVVPDADIVDILYSAIDGIGKEKIRMGVTSNIESSRKYCAEIIEKCAGRMGPGASEEELGTLCEALLHFMLTAAVLPSERKVRLNNVDLNVVIPSLRMLNKSPEKCLVIQVVKTGEDLARIKQVEAIQPQQENIWIISARRLQTGHKNYYLGDKGMPYSQLVADIHSFLADKGVKGLKLLSGR